MLVKHWQTEERKCEGICGSWNPDKEWNVPPEMKRGKKNNNGT